MLRTYDRRKPDWRPLLPVVPPMALERGIFKLDQKLDLKQGRPRIRCPHCRWQPKRGHLWTCFEAGPPENFSPGCLTTWNTFDTRGKCPGCKYQWRHTMCLACTKWSLHDDWYEPADPTGKGP